LIQNKKDITHSELCLAVAKRFNKKVALYEYQSFVSGFEHPDVLIFTEDHTELFEIKTSLSDFKKDQYKECRKKYRLQYWAYHLPVKPCDMMKENVKLKLDKGHLDIVLIEREHLGNYRYFVCPWGVIPIEKIPEGWGLYYYKGGKFFLKKQSERFRSNLRTEINLATHALRRYASGDNTGILIKTYHVQENFGIRK